MGGSSKLRNFAGKRKCIQIFTLLNKKKKKEQGMSRRYKMAKWNEDGG